MTTRFSPLSRSPDLVFKKATFKPPSSKETFTYKENVSTLLGTVEALASLPGWADTPMYFKAYRVKNGPREYLVLGSRCGPLHTPHLNARATTKHAELLAKGEEVNSRRSGKATLLAEELWCTNCWADSLINIPFYMYYRHYDDHILGKLPACPVCEKRFQIWEPDEPLAPGNAYLLSALRNAELESTVEILLSTNKE